MRRQKKKKLINKWYLLFAALVVLFGTCNILFNSTIRETLGLSPEPVRLGAWFSSFFGGGRQAAAIGAIEPITAAELETFADAFENRAVRTYAVPPEEVPKEAKPRPGSRPEEDPVYASLWPMRVKGTFTDVEDGSPTAFIGNEYCKVGRTLFSKKEGRCGYQILGIGTRCVWMLAYDRSAGAVPEIPEIGRWPDVSFIVSERHSGQMVPMRIRFAGGQEYPIGRLFKVSRDDQIVYKVVKLWQNGACFEARKGQARLFLACMLVVNR